MIDAIRPLTSQTLASELRLHPLVGKADSMTTTSVMWVANEIDKVLKSATSMPMQSKAPRLGASQAIT
jgi:hypothetical protein